MDQITFSTALVNTVLQYLGNRPYAEVFQLVEAIQKEAQNQPKKEEQVETHE
jgi:hypothetical protein